MSEQHEISTEGGPPGRRATLGVVAAILFACAWLTCLIPPLLVFDNVNSSPAYDAQLLGLLAGHWDLPQDIIAGEAFSVNGRTYTYFGPTPVLLRAPFAELVARYPMKLGFVSLFMAGAVALWVGLRVHEELSGVPATAVQALSLGGLVLSIVSRRAIYHEAIAWGSAFALLAGWHALRYLRAPSLPKLAAVGLCCALAVFARPIWLLAALVLLFALAASALISRRLASRSPGSSWTARLARWLHMADARRPGAHAALALGGIAAIVFTAAAIHRAKFGAWGFVPPIERHVGFQDPERLARIGGNLFHLANLPTGLYNYVSPATVDFLPTFPWISPTDRVRLLPGARIDGVDHMFGLPHIAGALILLSCIGAWSLARGRVPRYALVVVVALGLAASALFTFVGLCGRYLYDFYPVLVVGSALGWAALPRRPSRALRALVLLLAAYNLAAGLSMAFCLQRDLGPEPRKLEMRRLGEALDAFVMRR